MQVYPSPAGSHQWGFHIGRYMSEQEWWHTANRQQPAEYPVDVTCPCCQRLLLGWASYRVVLIRHTAHCRDCDADIALQRCITPGQGNAEMMNQVNRNDLIPQTNELVKRVSPLRKLAQPLLDIFRDFGG